MFLEQYLEKVLQKTSDSFGRQYRGFFADNKGSAELAMLASPSKEEAQQLKIAVAIMTEDEKKNAERLTDEQVRKIAKDANIDSGMFAIFINGYALYCKKK
jgi:glycerol dehydrogenase-like iron-containing ADH family enzyme